MTASSIAHAQAPDTGAPPGPFATFNLYELRHMAAHLNDNLRYQELFRLLDWETGEGSNAWYQAKTAVDPSGVAFLDDVRLAWSSSEQINGAAAERGEPVALLDCELRCALVIASIQSMYGSIPPALIFALVDKQIWPQHLGLASLSMIPDDHRRAAALHALQSRLSGPARDQALANALDATHRIADEPRRAEMLATLIPHLPQRMLATARETARSIENRVDRSQLLVAVASRLSNADRSAVITEALTASRHIQKEQRVELLAAMVPCLTGQVLDTVLDAARSEEVDDERVAALVALAPLPEPVRSQILAEALTITQSIYDENRRSARLVAMAPHLPPQLLDDALAQARGFYNGHQRAPALAALAPRFPEPKQRAVLGEVLQAVRGHLFEPLGSRVLIAVASYLPEQLLAKGISAARSISDPQGQADALVALAVRLAEPAQSQILAEALDVARKISDAQQQVAALAALATRLPEPARTAALAIALPLAMTVQFDGGRTIALESLAPHLRGSLLAEGLAAAERLSDAGYARVLTALAPHLSQPLLANALRAAANRGGTRCCCQAVVALAPHLMGELVSTAIAAIQELDESERANALVALSPRLSDPLLSEALIAARNIMDERHRAVVLEALAPRLPAHLLGDALAIAQIVGDERNVAAALGVLTPRLFGTAQSDALRVALALTGHIGDESIRGDSLAGLAPYLTETSMPAALAVIQGLRNEWLRSRALAAVAPHLPRQFLPHALEIAQELSTRGEISAMAALAPHLTAPLRVKAAKAARRVKDEGKRNELLAALAPYLRMPVPRTMMDIATESAWSLTDAEQRKATLASLAPHRPAALLEDLLPSGRATVRSRAGFRGSAVSDEQRRAEAFVALSPFLSTRLLQAALAFAITIGDEEVRAATLVGVAPWLPQALLAEAVQAARRIGVAGFRSRALAGLATHMTEPARLKTVAEALAAAGMPQGWRPMAVAEADDRYRAIALAELAPHLTTALMSDALNAARNISHVEDQVVVLVALAPHLPESALNAALTAARDLPDEDRLRVLSVLAPRLPFESLKTDVEIASRKVGYAVGGKEARAAIVAMTSCMPRSIAHGVWAQALSSACDVADERRRSETLTGIAPNLPDSLLATALAASRRIQDPDARTSGLAALAPRLALLPRAQLYPLWRETLHELGTLSRKDLLAVLSALLPVIVALGPSGFEMKVALVIGDVARWWP